MNILKYRSNLSISIKILPKEQILCMNINVNSGILEDFIYYFSIKNNDSIGGNFEIGLISDQKPFKIGSNQVKIQNERFVLDVGKERLSNENNTENNYDLDLNFVYHAKANDETFSPEIIKMKNIGKIAIKNLSRPYIKNSCFIQDLYSGLFINTKTDWIAFNL